MIRFLKIDYDADSYSPQSEHNLLTCRLNKIGLPHNASKCEVTSCTSSLTSILFCYYKSGTFLTKVTLVKNYCILFSNLNFHPHIEHICCKARKALGFIKQIPLDLKLLSSLKRHYCSLVKSLFEYMVLSYGTHILHPTHPDFMSTT